MRDSLLLSLALWGLLAWAVLGVTEWIIRALSLDERYPTPVEEDEPEYMECPYCKDIAFPLEGGECTSCHLEAYF